MANKRIRVVHHPLQVNLLVAVRTRLLLTHDAPPADAELVESERWGKLRQKILYFHINKRPSHSLPMATQFH